MNTNMHGTRQNDRIVDIIQRYFDRKKNNNPRYSKRALSRDLNLAPSFVIDVLNRKKPFPYKQIEQWAHVLDMDQSTKLELYKQFSPKDFSDLLIEKNLQKNWEIATRGQLQVLKKWYYLPMLELTTCSNFDGDFAKALGISQDEEEQAIELLLKLKLIKYQNGKFQKTNTKLHFQSSKSVEEFRNYHSLLLDKSKNELRKNSPSDFEKRMIQSFSVAIPEDKIDLIKKKINDVIYKSLEEITDEPATNVYHFGIQFYPLTKN